jgi:hypothetical protein
MDDVIGQGRGPERDPRPPLPRHWRVAAWAMAGVVAGLAVFGLSRQHGAGSPGSSRASASAPATWPAAQGGIAGVMFTGVQGPIAFAASAGGPGMVCSPSTGACSVRVQAPHVVPASAEPAARATARPALRAPGLW